MGSLSLDPLVDSSDGYSQAQYQQAHWREQALLFNPYVDDPGQYFAYVTDELTQEVTLVAPAPRYRAHVRAAEAYYGLNRIDLTSQ